MNLSKKIIGGIITVCALGLFYSMDDYNHPDLELKNNSITIEYGEQLSDDMMDYVNTSIYDDNGIIDEIEYFSDIDYYIEPLDVGNYTMTYKLRNTEKTLNITVKDTTSPHITLLKDISVFENNKPNYNHFIKVEELSHYNVDIDDQNVKYNTPGHYICYIQAIDDYGNESSIDVAVEVKEVKIDISQANISLMRNGQSQIEITTNSHDPITYTSSDSDIVSVDSSGIIEAKKAGTATITATVDGKKATCKVTVTSPKTYTSSTSSSTNRSSSSTSSQSTLQNTVGYTVYRTKTGSKYHRDGCRYLSRSQIAISKTDAINMGLTPCSVCNP